MPVRDSLWKLAAVVAGDVPVPGLGSCVEILRQVDEAVQNVKLQRAQCSHLVDLAANVLLCIANSDQPQPNSKNIESPESKVNQRRDNESINTSETFCWTDGTPEKQHSISWMDRHVLKFLNIRLRFRLHGRNRYDLHQVEANLTTVRVSRPVSIAERHDDKLGRIKNILEKISTLSKEIAGYSFGEVMVRSSDIENKIHELENDLLREVELFQFSASIRVTEWLSTLEAARKTDAAAQQEIKDMLDKIGKEMQEGFDKVRLGIEDVRYEQAAEKGAVCFSDDSDNMNSDEYEELLNTTLAADRPWQMIFKLPIELRDSMRKPTNIRPAMHRADCNAQDGSQMPVVVKRYRTLTKEQRNNLCKELEICSYLKHPNIVTFYGINTLLNPQYAQSLNLVSEYCEHRDVGTYLKKLDKWRERNQPFPEPDLLLLLSDVAAAIKYLHTPTPCKQGKIIVHGDIRPAKILVTGKLRAKLTSFRRSKTLDDAKESATSSFTRCSDNFRWRAPESHVQVEDAESYDNLGVAGDIYGWALTSGSVLTGVIPFLGVDIRDLEGAIKNGSPFKADVLEKLEAFGVRDLLERCWHTNAEKRPHIDQVFDELESIRLSRKNTQ